MPPFTSIIFYLIIGQKLDVSLPEVFRCFLLGVFVFFCPGIAHGHEVFEEDFVVLDFDCEAFIVGGVVYVSEAGGEYYALFHCSCW